MLERTCRDKCPFLILVIITCTTVRRINRVDGDKNVADNSEGEIKFLEENPDYTILYIRRYPMASESNDCSWWFMYFNDSFIGSKL